MYKVIISKIFPKIESNDPIELHNPQDLYELRRIKYDANDNVGPFLVQIVESHYATESLVRAKVCYNGEWIYNFVRRTIEQRAVAIGMTYVFNE